MKWNLNFIHPQRKGFFLYQRMPFALDSVGWKIPHYSLKYSKANISTKVEYEAKTFLWYSKPLSLHSWLRASNNSARIHTGVQLWEVGFLKGIRKLFSLLRYGSTLALLYPELVSFYIYPGSSCILKTLVRVDTCVCVHNVSKRSIPLFWTVCF